MKTATELGIWMDHQTAHLMEFTTDPIQTTTLDSKFTHEEKELALGKSESLMHHKEQHEQASYYKALGEIIRSYNAVLLFGPTDAKVELFNLLGKDHRFEAVKIDVEQTDKMTTNQQHAYVKAYFSKRLSLS